MHRVMNYSFKIVIYLFFTLPCLGQDKLLQSNIKYLTEKAQNYLDKEKSLSGFYSIDEKGIKMYASANDKLIGKTEFFLDWKYLPLFKSHEKHSEEISFNLYKKGNYNAETVQPVPKLAIEGKYLDRISSPTENELKYYKIAIDPGHIANDFIIGDLEKKHIKIKGDSINGIIDSIEIAEGIITFATAELLKDKLEKEGAQVFLTRTADKCAFGKTFEQWKKDDLKAAVDSLYKTGELKASQKEYFLSKKAKDRDIFRVIFRDLELAKRAELINNYKPDFTIVIHYNVDETNLEWEKCSNKNLNMTFVAGSFMKNDLLTKEKRFEFLRLLITDDLEKSIALSGAVVRNFERELHVPTATIRDAKYLMEGCLPSGIAGVYCRNLQLPRYIHSPVVYGETLFQDNINECKMLHEETDKKKNKRVQQVAEAYFKGIMEYVNGSSSK